MLILQWHGTVRQGQRQPEQPQPAPTRHSTDSLPNNSFPWSQLKLLSAELQITRGCSGDAGRDTALPGGRWAGQGCEPCMASCNLWHHPHRDKGKPRHHRGLSVSSFKQQAQGPECNQGPKLVFESLLGS